MLRLPVFETAPTMTFSLLQRKSLQRRAIVRVLPQPGGPLMNVNPFFPHLEIAQFWRSLKSFWFQNLICLLGQIQTLLVSPLKYLMICQLSVNSCIWYQLLSTEYRPLQALMVGLTRARQQLQPLITPNHDKRRSDDTYILPFYDGLGRQSSPGLNLKISSPQASHNSSENLLAVSNSATRDSQDGSKSKC